MKSSIGPSNFAEQNLSDQASTTNRLGKKIRSQAAQLADLTERLIQQEAYSRLVETRLLELDPSHGLPVTPQQLERNEGGRGDRSATGLRRSARSQSTACGRSVPLRALALCRTASGVRSSRHRRNGVMSLCMIAPPPPEISPKWS